jgi:hypothetical protein
LVVGNDNKAMEHSGTLCVAASGTAWVLGLPLLDRNTLYFPLLWSLDPEGTHAILSNLLI